MPLTEKALVAINDSEEALNAFSEALQLSRRGLQLAAVCVAPPYQGDLSLTGVRALKRTIDEPCLTVLDEAVRIAGTEGVIIHTFKAMGKRHEAIIDLAVRERCRVIIIGQVPGCFWIALGGLTAKLLRYSPIDLLIVPKQRPVRVDRVLYSVFEDQHRSAISKGIRLIRNRINKSHPDRDQSLSCCNHEVNTSAPRFVRDVLRIIAGGSTSDVMVCSCDRSQILRCAKNDKIDLIVINGKSLTEPRGFFTALKTLDIVRKSSWPIWIVKA